MTVLVVVTSPEAFARKPPVERLVAAMDHRCSLGLPFRGERSTLPPEG